MTRVGGSTVLGYHGCSGDTARKLLAGAAFEPSEKDFDWLGPGAYFWENDPRRALEWATDKARRGACDDPMVVGAVIALGRCLDLTTRDDLELLGLAHESLKEARELAGLEMPENADLRGDPHGDRKLRYLDCAVIRHLERNIADEAAEVRAKGGTPAIEPIQTVRGLFIEGGELYPGGGFYERTHSQIAVLDPAAILGAFLPRPYPRL